MPAPTTPALTLTALDNQSFAAAVSGDAGGTVYRLFYARFNELGFTTGPTRVNPGSLTVTGLTPEGQYAVYAVADNGQLSYPALAYLSLALPDTLIAAVRARWEGSPTLLALAGELYTAEVPEKLDQSAITLPYAYVDPDKTHFDWTFVSEYYESTHLDFHLYAKGVQTVEAAAAELRRVFDWKKLAFRNPANITLVFAPSGYSLHNEAVRYADGATVYRACVSYQSVERRLLPS